MKRLPPEPRLSINWDLFVDEQKEKNKLSGIGVLCLEIGVVCHFYRELIKAKDKIQSKVTGGRIGEIHWTSLGGDTTAVAKSWLEVYFHAPLCFFVYAPIEPGSKNRFDLVKDIIEKLENDDRVPHGLSRSFTTIHLDYDSNDVSNIWTLRRQFGLLRAFPWDSKGSPILQLSDLLLGAASFDYHKPQPTGTKKENYKREILKRARDLFQKRQRNLLIAYDKSGSRTLLE